MEFETLFTPVKIGKLHLPNRLVVPAMATNLANEDGSINDAFISYYKAKAYGGWGLIIIEFTAIDPLGKTGPRTPGLWSDNLVHRWRRLTEEIHGIGARVAIQLSHAGRQTESRIIGTRPVAPSPVPCPIRKEVPHELENGEVYELIGKFGSATRRAQEAGFDAVEIHGAHGYLVAQFLSPYSNRRTDEFGGDLWGRTKFAREVIKEIRRQAGDDFPVLFRISAEERVPGGLTIEETAAIGRILEEVGIDALSVSVGVNATAPFIIAPAAVQAGHLLRLSRKLKGHLSVPLITVGRIDDPILANQAVRAGWTDLVALGRPSIADPELPRKLISGKVREIRPCIYCLQGCLRTYPHPDRPLPDFGITCTVNPFAGREKEFVVRPAESRRKVVVVGGGPAGLSAAATAASRGHEVLLLEREGQLGGQLRLASLLPLKQYISRAIKYYTERCKDAGVDLRLGVEATEANLLRLKPDVLIIATGAEPAVPEVLKGHPRLVTIRELLLGYKGVGKKVLILGGGAAGCEVADFLGEQGKDVTIVEQQELASDIHPSIEYFLFERLHKYGVRRIMGVTIKGFLEDGIEGERMGRVLRLRGFDSLVFCMGSKPIRMRTDLLSSVPVLFVIGDAAMPRKAINAIEDGVRVGLLI